MLEEILRNAEEYSVRLRREPAGDEAYAKQEGRLRTDAKYRSALQDKMLAEEELNYLVLFEVTRVEFYRPNTEGIIERIWDEFARRVGTDAETAEDVWGTIEQKANDHYNTMQFAFGRYAGEFKDVKQ